MFCPNCGSLVENGELFCGNCGCKIEQEQEKPVQTGVYPGVRPNVYTNTQGSPEYKPIKSKSKKTLIITLIVVAALAAAGITATILIPKLTKKNYSSSGYSDYFHENFSIEGKWKNVGDTTCAQMQKGSIITFDGENCNVYSPSDTYAFYESGGEFHLDCTSFFAGDSLCFTVKIIDSDNIQLINGSTCVSLCRVGGTPVTAAYDSGYNENTYSYDYNNYTYSTTRNYSQQHTYRVIQADVSWFEAKAECESKGGHLATITSQSEYEEICRLAENSGLKYIWLGARIYSASDNFNEWITGEPINFTKWYPGEPSKADVDGTEEFYLCMWNIKYDGMEMGWTFNDQRNDLLTDESVRSGSVGYVIEYEN